MRKLREGMCFIMLDIEELKKLGGKYAGLVRHQSLGGEES